MANPNCHRCKGTGITHTDGSPRRQIGCPAEGCSSWTRDPTLAELAAKTDAEVRRLEGLLAGARMQAEAAHGRVANACTACQGSRKVTLNGQPHDCPACKPRPAACATCADAGQVELAGKTYSCPAACSAARLVAEAALNKRLGEGAE